MSVNVLRRYRSVIDLMADKFIKNYPGERALTIMSLDLGPKGYGFKLQAQLCWNWSKRIMRAIEISKNVFYVGLDLSSKSFTFSVESMDRLPARVMHKFVRDAYGIEVKNAPDAFIRDCNNSYYDIQRDKDEKALIGTTAFMNIVEMVMRVSSGILKPKFRVKVKDGEWPELKNREFVPIFMVNVEKDDVSVYNTVQTFSWKRNRSIWLFSTLRVDTWVRNSNIPRFLLDFELLGPLS